MDLVLASHTQHSHPMENRMTQMHSFPTQNPTLNIESESSDLCINTRACLDPQLKVTAQLLLL